MVKDSVEREVERVAKAICKNSKLNKYKLLNDDGKDFYRQIAIERINKYDARNRR
jgi:hypothetical protein